MPSVRHGGRPKRAQQRADILDWIDNYWPDINADFAEHFGGTDACEWFRGTRPWSQFVDYFNRLSVTEGTGVYTALLSDDRLEEQFAKAVDPDNPGRPSLLSYSRVAREIRALHRSVALSGHLTLPDEPEYPHERAKAKADQINDALLLGELFQANPTLRGVPAPDWN